jgi:hypothetical protein
MKSSGVSKKEDAKLSKTTKASRGSVKTMQMSKPRHNTNDIKLVIPQLKDSEINSILNDQYTQNCCTKRNCLIRCFTDIDSNRVCYDNAIEAFRNCREITRTKNSVERQAFLIDGFKKSIIEIETDGVSDSIRYNHCWKLPGYSDKVCRLSWAKAYNFSPYELDKCSTILKQNFHASSLSHKAYTDATVHAYSYNETEAIFMSNVVDSDYGDKKFKYIYYLYILYIIIL